MTYPRHSPENTARQARIPCNPRRRSGYLPALLLAILLAACSPAPPAMLPLPEDAVILAFGDSLTFGTGAPRDGSYPAHLARLTGLEVINAGVPGEVSRQGRERLPRLLDDHRPDLLVLIHGGNDMLRRMDMDQKQGNLATMIHSAQERGIQVMLVAVPAPTLLRLRNAQTYETLAAEFGIPLENRALAHILSRDDLKADPIHPNGDGYRVLAEYIKQTLTGAGGL
ncbi:arylesterase [Ectothiorhodospira lacustris]|uniref:arylesterase n=1 Tax=Ectothiorhodospira lacustris TaxID=2899127 RepID=UPI001EE94054|nr:arylesterase [Ectothiorhodospira lacustris]MCG5502199.1 arylesterase [Ectothiorhodospira lacustris]MCG5509321.1 arylesterase [Ectothiorhodospira lacustris]MCG5521375.1 arylesterase [Ectothiorhodospira lacustris]